MPPPIRRCYESISGWRTFSIMERDYLRNIKEVLEMHGYDVKWPYEFFTKQDVAKWGKDAPVNIMTTNSSVLETCDAVVAVLEGPQIDDGTAWEVGYACAKNIPVVGFRTDFRKCGDAEHATINSMVQGGCYSLPHTLYDVVQSLKEINTRRQSSDRED